MVWLQKSVRAFVRDERGLSTTEYGLLIAFIGVALIAIVKVVGPALSDFFNKGATDFQQQAGQ